MRIAALSALCLALLCASCEGLQESVQEARKLFDPDSAIWPARTDPDEGTAGETGAPASEPREAAAPKNQPIEDIDERLISHPERIVFRYTDEQGDLHFVTGIDNVPMEHREKVSVVDGSKLGTYDPVPIAARPRTAAKTPATGELRGRPGGEWNSNQIKWVPLAQAKTHARRVQKPIVVVIYTSWCPHCKDYKKLFDDPEVAAMAKQFVMVRGDSDQVPELDRDYAPDGRYIPRTVFLSPTGQLDTGINTGGKSKFNFHGSTPDRLLGGMREALKKYGS